MKSIIVMLVLAVQGFSQAKPPVKLPARSAVQKPVPPVETGWVYSHYRDEAFNKESEIYRLFGSYLESKLTDRPEIIVKCSDSKMDYLAIAPSSRDTAFNPANSWLTYRFSNDLTGSSKWMLTETGSS